MLHVGPPSIDPKFDPLLYPSLDALSGAPLERFLAILVDLGGLEDRFWKLLDALTLERALSFEEATTCEKLEKTNGFCMFFSCPLSRARFENQPKIDPKTLRKRVARHIACKTRFFPGWRSQNDSQ